MSTLSCSLTKEQAAYRLAEAPELALTEDEERQVRGAFQNWLLYWPDACFDGFTGSEDGVSVACTYCGHQELWTKKEWAVWRRDNNRVTDSDCRCPYCGWNVKLQARGRIRSGASLTRHGNFLFFRDTKAGLYVYARKVYRYILPINQEDGLDEMRAENWGLYFYAPGIAQRWRWVNGWPDTGHLKAAREIVKPWPAPNWQTGLDDPDYIPVWPENTLRDGPCRYFAVPEAFGDWPGYGGGVVEFLGLSALYPQTEMLAKAGAGSVLIDMCMTGKYHGDVFRWRRKGLTGLTGLPKVRAKEWLNAVRDMDAEDAVLCLRMMKEGMDAEDAKWLLKADAYQNTELIRELGLTVRRLAAYIGKKPASLHEAFRLWRDYIHMAKKLGYDLSRADVILPKELWKAHDDAVGAIQFEENKAKVEAYRKRYKALCKRYEFRAFGLRIVVPKDDREIIQEGKTLQHCVGGYASRHLDGSTTILFLRKERTPGRSYVTLEMNDKEISIRQVHGFRNERYKGGGGFMGDTIRKKLAYFLGPWLDWVKAGSKRDRKGNPILPETIKEA